eukprot:NODE_455_length_7230_cov_0.733277.p5 type:complete len:103 gc:universal NODE_455_length_7230_cov_0.733277:2506-2814(+)
MASPTNSISTSLAYSFNSVKTLSILSSLASFRNKESFSNLTYGGSLYLTKKGLKSPFNSVGNCSTITCIFLKNEKISSGTFVDNNVTKGPFNFFSILSVNSF